MAMARLIALGAAVALGLGVAGCGDDEQEVTVGLITKQEENPFWVKMRETAEKTAGDNNVDLLTATGTSDVDSDEPGGGAGGHDPARREGHPDRPGLSRPSCRRSRRPARPASR